MVSKYNILYEFQNKYYVYNLVSRKLVNVDFQVYKMIRENKINIESVCDKEELIEAGIYYDEIIDENSIILDNYFGSVYDNKLNIVIMASTGCNFKCQYCYEMYENRSINDYFCVSFLKFLKKNIRKYKALNIEWFGGEPMLVGEKIYELSRKIKKICEQFGITYVASMTTNGYLLEKKIFEKLVEVNILNYQITIDGMEKEHNILRPLKSGDGTFKRIFDNLIDIKSIERHKYFNIIVRNNVNKKNINSCNEFITLYEKYFSDDKRFTLHQHPIMDWGGERIKDMKEDLIKEDIIYLKNNIYAYSDILDSCESMMCFASKKNAFVIDPELKVYKCSHYIMNMKNPCKNNEIGFIDSNGKLIIDKKDELKWIFCIIDDECKICKYYPYCLYKVCPCAGLKKKNNCEENILKCIKEKLALLLQRKNAI